MFDWIICSKNKNKVLFENTINTDRSGANKQIIYKET